MLIALLCLFTIILLSFSLRNNNRLPIPELLKLTSCIWFTAFLINGFLYFIIELYYGDLFKALFLSILGIVPELIFSIPGFIIYTLICSIIIPKNYKRSLLTTIPIITFIITTINFLVDASIQNDESIFSILKDLKIVASLIIIIITFTLSSFFWIKGKITSSQPSPVA